MAAGPGTEVVESQVTAEMTATITVEGAAAGTCTSPPTALPANGSGSLSCSSAPAGAQYAAARARKQGGAPPGTPVTVAATAQASVVAQAAVTARVEQMLDDLGQRRRESLGNMCALLVVEASTSASGGDRCQSYVSLRDVVPAADRRRFSRQRNSTYAGLYVGRTRIGKVHRSRGEDGHAEQRLADGGDWEDALATAYEQGATLDLVINRTPCATSCQDLLEELARHARTYRNRGVPLRVISTGAYTGGSTPDAATTDWITAMMRLDATILVGVPRGGMRPGGRQLAKALDNVNPPPG